MTNLRALGIVLVLLGAPALASAGDDHDMTLDEVPAKVKATIDKQIGEGSLEDLEQKKLRNKTVYEAEFLDADNQRFEIVVAEDGKLLDKRLDKRPNQTGEQTEKQIEKRTETETETQTEKQPEPRSDQP